MSEPTEGPRTHGEIVLDVVRSGYSSRGDKTWSMQELADRTGLRPHQVSNAIARIAREARQKSEEPILRVKTGAKGEYIYWGALKRGRKPKDVVHAATPTEEVPFTDEELADNTLLDPNTQLASEDETVVIVDVAAKPTLADGLAQIGEKMQAAFGDIAASIHGSPTGRLTTPARPPLQSLRPPDAVEKQRKTNRVSRIRRMMHDLSNELRYLENDWDVLAEKGKRYDELSLKFRGFSSPNTLD